MTARPEDMIVLSDGYAKAFAYALELHREQPHKGTHIPYVSHLMAVSSLVLEHGGNEVEAIAALLHDAIEDQGRRTSVTEIGRRFGDEVAAIVEGCSDTDVIPIPPWRERKDAYVAHVQHASRSMRLVSAADKLHNARSILIDYRRLGEPLWSRFTGSKEETLWYYRALVNAYLSASGEPTQAALVAELDGVVAELEQLVRVPVRLSIGPGRSP